MQDYQGWYIPAGGQAQGSPPVSAVSSSYNAPPAPQTQAHYNNYTVVSPQGRPYNAFEAVSPAPSSSNYPPSSQNGNCGSYGVPAQYGQSSGYGNVVSPPRNGGDQHFVLTPPREQPPSGYVVSPQNSDNNRYPSPEISPGSWNVPSPESMTTVEGYDKNPFGTMTSSHSVAPSTVSPVERPLIRPTVAVGKGYDHIPDLPMRQQNASKYQRVPDIRRESKMRQKNQDSMLRPGQRPAPARSLEKMATSTRQNKPKPPMPNHQTIHTFKYKLDHDREKIAQSKALDLMNMMSF